MEPHADRIWAKSYAPGVPLDIDVPEESLVDLLDSSVQRFGPLVALDFFGAATTYAELGEQVAKAAEGLRRLGVAAGDRVALVLPNCPQHVVAFYAVLRLGGVVVEHNPLYTAEEMSFQLADHRPKVIVVWDKVAPMVREIADSLGVEALLSVNLPSALPRTKRWALRMPVSRARETRAAMSGPAPGIPGWEPMVARSPALDPGHPRPAVGDVALLQYTGGTTGKPKAAVLTHRNLRANAAQGRAWMPGLADGEEVIYAVLPLFHAYGLTLCLTFAVEHRGDARAAAPVRRRHGARRRTPPPGDVPAGRAADLRAPGDRCPASEGVDLTSDPLCDLRGHGSAEGDRRAVGVGHRRDADGGLRHDRDLARGAGQPGRSHPAHRRGGGARSRRPRSASSTGTTTPGTWLSASPGSCGCAARRSSAATGSGRRSRRRW